MLYITHYKRNKAKKKEFFKKLLIIISIMLSFPSFLFGCNVRTIEIALDTEFYFLCFGSFDDEYLAINASNENYTNGGANYVMKHNDKCVIVLACFYNKNIAELVKNRLCLNSKQCFVFSKELESINLNYSLGAELIELIEENFVFLINISVFLYELANGLETDKFSQEEAKVDLMQRQIEGEAIIQKNNNYDENGLMQFSQIVNDVIFIFDSIKSNYVLTSDVRNAHIFIAENICKIYKQY